MRFFEMTSEDLSTLVLNGLVRLDGYRKQSTSLSIGIIVDF